MLKKQLSLSFVLAFLMSVPLLAHEGSSQQGSKEMPAPGKAATESKEKSTKESRWEGIVERSDKDASTLTVRKQGVTANKIIHYDSSTKWVSQMHGSKTANNIAPGDVKEGDRVICVGTADNKGEFHATLISKRLVP
jgi:hypothetical protein